MHIANVLMFFYNFCVVMSDDGSLNWNV